MDDGVDDETTAINGVDSTHVQCKDNEYSTRADSGNMLESHEVIIPGEGECNDNSSHIFETILEDKNFDRSGVMEHQYSSSHCMDVAGIMVEELMLRNYEDGNLGIVGTSNSKERVQPRQNQWQHLYQIAGGGSGSGSSHGDFAYRDNHQATSTVWENMDYMKFPDVLGPKPLNVNHNEVMENSPDNGSKAVSGNKLFSPGGIRTKMLSKSGFCEYFVKNTLKGKGIVCKGPAPKGSGIELRSKTDSKAVDSARIASDALLSLSAKTVLHPYHVPRPDTESIGLIDSKAAGYAMVSFDSQLSAGANTVMTSSDGGVGSRPDLCLDACHHGINLRDWLKARGHKVNKVESLYIFKQILGIVECFHSEGVILQDLRPSFFILLPLNRVLFLGSSSGKGIMENARNGDIYHLEIDRNEKRPMEQDMNPTIVQCAKKHKFGENMNFIRCHPTSSRYGKFAAANDADVNIDSPQDAVNKCKEGRNPKVEFKSQCNFSRTHVSNTSQLPLTSVSDMMEEKWYMSTEELNNRSCTFASNIYCLGILLFELLGSFDSVRAREAAMSDLHHRILPPNFLSENPKEAGFCLWLLHPAPSSRPTAREILQSDMINGIQESCGVDLLPSIHEDDAESELLLHFLMSLKEQKQKDTSKLVEEIKCLEADIEEAESQQKKNSLVFPCSAMDSPGAGGSKIPDRQHPRLELHSELLPAPYNELNLRRNISQLESAYFSMRSNNQLSDSDATTCTNKELLTHRQNWFQAQKDEDKHKPTGHLGAFFNGLCKYARYSKFEVRGLLRNGDFSSSANVICSLSFDRDEDYFAAAGVSKKIKIYEFHALFNDSVDIHYPVIEMSNKSKLSCICWNNYIRNYLASTDYDGVVKLWDAGTGQQFSQYTEHNKRAWSVDFSQVDPTRLASGSDDCFVKLWSINAKNSSCTIRNIANVCCVQFSPYSTHLLAFGSSDYKTYCYDLRNASSPWCILAGHDKAVSHVKFLDSETLVSASTDNTLKLWDLNKTSSSSLSTTACTLTLRGHTNEKNFVGLSVSDGYIACGSETNEVYAYYRSLPMPITSHKFGSVDPISGKETEDDNGQFVSSVCWRQKSSMVVAANSSGCIKVLRMV